MVAAIQFAPLSVPLKRRLQTAAVLLWIVMVPFLFTVFFFLATYPVLRPFIAAYLIYANLDPSPEMGGRTSNFVRGWPLWRYLRDYFPIKLVKTVDLDPSRNYVFGFHPHGVIGLGAFINFATEANNFSKMFVGIDIHVLTLGLNFNAPFVRDILLALGVCSASRRSCDNILTRGPGASMMLVVGGALETVTRDLSNSLLPNNVFCLRDQH